jgi:hypothetical protein
MIVIIIKLTLKNVHMNNMKIILNDINDMNSVNKIPPVDSMRYWALYCVIAMAIT